MGDDHIRAVFQAFDPKVRYIFTILARRNHQVVGVGGGRLLLLKMESKVYPGLFIHLHEKVWMPFQF